MMPSPRGSPAIRPVSPRSPGYKSSHFDSLQPPSPRALHARPTSQQQRLPKSSLKLPSLPRFHPANFVSQSSSLQPTPDDQSPGQPPMSPRTHQRIYSEAQKQLFFNQREMLGASARAAQSAQHSGKPDGPRLKPAGSPGPITPLELEGEEGYLLAGTRSHGNDRPNSKELVERLIREEARRQAE